MELEAQGNNSYKVMPTQAVGFHTWSIKRSLSYDAKDFPVIAIFVEDPNMVFESGALRYSAGKNMSADDVHILNYSMYDDGTIYYGEGGEYSLMFIDMAALLDEAAFEEGWNGRINSLRFDYGTLSISNDPEYDFFFFHYAGIFRSVEEATAYGEAYAESLGLTAAPDEDETEEPGNDGTGEPGVDVTEPTVDVTEEPTTDANDATDAPATQAPAATDAPSTTEGGCASVIGSAAILLAAAAAAVVLKKRD